MLEKTHFIAMAGLQGGYLPQYCDVFETRQSAIESLLDLHDRTHGGKVAKNLHSYGYSTLSMELDGNEYAEVVPCSCDDPRVHSEHPLEWD